MMVDNEFVMTRRSVFKNAKYVIFARLEKAEGDSRKDGVVGRIKSTFKNMINDMKKNNKIVMESLRDEVLNSGKGLDSRFTDTASQIN